MRKGVSVVTLNLLCQRRGDDRGRRTATAFDQGGLRIERLPVWLWDLRCVG